MQAVGIQKIHAHVQAEAQQQARGQADAGRLAAPQQAARAGPKQPQQGQQQQRLRYRQQQGVRMAAMVQHIAERARQEPCQEQVEVGRIAGKPGRKQEQGAPRALGGFLRLGRQAAVQQLAHAEADHRMCNIIHSEILQHAQPQHAFLLSSVSGKWGNVFECLRSN